jgi:uncharacterized protein (TIGR03435 family)
MLARLPKWVSSDSFTVQARAEGNPTKDQMRLMMQSLLAERFQLAVHFETRQVPVFALALLKPRKTGPKLRPHADGPPCDAASPEVFPPVCDVYSMITNPSSHIRRAGSRNTTIALLAGAIPSFGSVDRPVLDETGLSGRFDFTLEWTPETNGPPSPNPNASAESDGPTFLDALREQLGLKLESTKGPVRTLVVDHVERPSEN